MRILAAIVTSLVVGTYSLVSREPPHGMRLVGFAPVHFHSPSSKFPILLTDFIARKGRAEFGRAAAFRTNDRVDPAHKSLLEPSNEVESENVVII